MRKEEIILSALTKDIDYAKKVVTHIKPDFFQDRKEKTVYSLIEDFWGKYSKLPTKDVLTIELDSLKNIPENEYEDTKAVLKSAFADAYEYDRQWLIDETEKFCKERAVYNAIMASVLIINGEDKKRTDSQIPKMLQDALSINFDQSLGHDYFRDAEERFKFYNQPESKISCDIELLNKVTNGGVNRKTLNIFVAPPKAGKSLALSSLAVAYLKQGYNVVYITEELAEFRIGERIDANLMNININDIRHLEEDAFMSKIDILKSKSLGRLKIKEYPTKTASCAHFSTLLDDYKARDDFIPDVIIVDYLGITASSQYSNASSVNSYTYQKAVSEELRAFGGEWNAAVWSAVQTNRGGMNASDFDVEDISDSIGPIMTCDLAIGLIRTPELDDMNQMIFKQLASRYGDTSYYKKFIVGLDKSRMRVYNVDTAAQSVITQEVGSSSTKKPPIERYSKGQKKEVKSDEWSFD